MHDPATDSTEFAVGRRFRVQWLESVDSTNRLLMAAARNGSLTDGAVVVADHQTAGRGRLDRRWDDEAGAALLASVLFEPQEPVASVHRYVAAVSVALADAVLALTDVRPQHKWPNDLVVGDRKLAGVLAETGVAPDGTVRALVVGAGTNVAQVPPAHRELAIACNEYAPTPVDRRELLVTWLLALEHLVDDPAAVDASIRDHSATLGTRVRVEGARESFEGMAVDLSDSGALVVRTDDGVERVVTVADVLHLRPS
ncbi:MAG: biotin--[acetyl-CoA-carboxylase] ligase [Acidimicrobiia bacterium]